MRKYARMSKSHWEWTKLKEYRRFFFIILCNKYEIKTTKNGHTHTLTPMHTHTHIHVSQPIDSTHTWTRSYGPKQTKKCCFCCCFGVSFSFRLFKKLNKTTQLWLERVFFFDLDGCRRIFLRNFFQSYSCARQFLELSFHIHTNESNQLSLCKTDSLAISVSFGLEINKTWL